MVNIFYWLAEAELEIKEAIECQVINWQVANRLDMDYFSYSSPTLYLDDNNRNKAIFIYIFVY